jgi:hypothetical protein
LELGFEAQFFFFLYSLCTHLVYFSTLAPGWLVDLCCPCWLFDRVFATGPVLLLSYSFFAFFCFLISVLSSAESTKRVRSWWEMTENNGAAKKFWAWWTARAVMVCGLNPGWLRAWWRLVAAVSGVWAEECWRRWEGRCRWMGATKLGLRRDADRARAEGTTMWGWAVVKIRLVAGDTVTVRSTRGAMPAG